MSFAQVSRGLVPCFYCGGSADQVDHVIPLSQGGSNEISNWVACCITCNAEKHSRTPEQWQAWRLKRGWCWPPRNPPAGLSRAESRRYRNGLTPQETAPGTCVQEECRNFPKVGQDTCRWHDPDVLAAREEAEQARQRALRAAGAA